MRITSGFCSTAAPGRLECRQSVSAYGVTGCLRSNKIGNDTRPTWPFGHSACSSERAEENQECSRSSAGLR